MLGREPRRFGLVDDAALEATARALLARFGERGTSTSRAPVGTLGIGVQQIVEIVRALADDARVLVLDEPTAALTGGEAERLFARLRRLRARAAPPASTSRTAWTRCSRCATASPSCATASTVGTRRTAERRPVAARGHAA